MKKIFSFQHKVILAFLLLMNASFFLTGYMAKNLTESMILKEKQNKLVTLARILDSRLDSGGFESILKQRGAIHDNRDEQIKTLNRALTKFTDDVALSAPGLGVGYYSRGLEAIITYGPSEMFGHTVGTTIPSDHPGRTVMREKEPLVRSGTMVRGDILNAMIPIERHGKVIGYIWANELTTDVTAQIRAMSRNIFGIMIVCLLLTVGLLFLLSRRTIRNVNSLISGVRAMRGDISHRMKESRGELGEVARNINAMAEDIGKANEETTRAVSVLQSVLANVDAAVYVCEPETKKLVYANEYLCSLIGRETLQGEVCHKALYNAPKPCAFCPQKKLFDAQGAPALDAVRWENHGKIAERDFLVTDRLITWHDGRLLHMQVGADVTERNALAMAESANLAQRDFLARMSHEIRTPMNGVLGMTRLAMQASPPPAQMEYLKKIQSSASLLLGIINDILDFSRIEAGKITIEREAFNLHEMVENIRELILPRAQEKSLSLMVKLDDSVPRYAIGDELRLSQVLLNLLGNASKFTLDGYIALEMKAAAHPSGALRLYCIVADSGIGMSVAQQQALFTPFSQADSSTSRQFGGTGLGLSISKALVELMGGEIAVRSESGKGSTFDFYVDLHPAEGPQTAGETSHKPWEGVRYTGAKLLLVEDNVINQEIAISFLSDMGASIDVAFNGEEGLNAFMRNDYTAILMDVRMPVMDGLEATRRIRASGKHDATSIPIIAMTANAMHEDRETCKDAGMNGHIAKPIDIDDLQNILFTVLKKEQTTV